MSLGPRPPTFISVNYSLSLLELRINNVVRLERMRRISMRGSLSDAVRLGLSDKHIFGRDNLIKNLQDSMERITHHEGTPEVLLVTGASGTGK